MIFVYLKKELTLQYHFYINNGSKDKEEILYASFDLDELASDRLSWGIFRDRRVDTYIL